MNQNISKSIEAILQSAKEGIWIGRCEVPASMAYKSIAGPHVVQIKEGEVYDLSKYFGSSSELINTENIASKLENFKSLSSLGSLSQLLENSIYSQKVSSLPYFISPNDAQAIKACGLTFIQSLLERVIEEKAKGDPGEAASLRAIVTEKIGADLQDIIPGSDQAMKLKEEFKAQGLWSQYLEVGLGKDAVVFTKSQPFSAVGFGAEIGILEDSTWNNPEPEVVLAVSNKGEIKGATLGNDVNLRDYEGRSASLLSVAKDQNGSCAIGPFFRLFDETFNLETAKEEIINLSVTGKDGFHLGASSEMGKISRSPEDLVAQAIGSNHQYPDGLVLFCGTMFAPGMDRDIEGLGFTHWIEDEVIIHSKHLGHLINWVNTCDQIPK